MEDAEGDATGLAPRQWVVGAGVELGKGLNVYGHSDLIGAELRLAEIADAAACGDGEAAATEAPRGRLAAEMVLALGPGEAERAQLPLWGCWVWART